MLKSEASPIQLLELPTTPLRLEPRQLLAHAPITPVAVPTGGFTTNPYVAPPETAYAPAGAGAPAIAANFAKTTIEPVAAPKGAFTTNNFSTAPPRAAYALAEHLNNTLLLGPWQLLHASPTPIVHLATPTSNHQGISINTNRPNFPLCLPVALSPYPRETCSASAAFYTCGSTSTPSSNPTFHHYAYPAMTPPAQPLVLLPARFPIQSWY